MPSKNLHHAENPRTQNQNNAMSDPRDGPRVTDKPGAVGKKAPVEKPPKQNAEDEATLEEFGERGMGVAPKE